LRRLQDGDLELVFEEFINARADKFFGRPNSDGAENAAAGEDEEDGDNSSEAG
jgi:hypothetical protein